MASVIASKAATYIDGVLAEGTVTLPAGTASGDWCFAVGADFSSGFTTNITATLDGDAMTGMDAMREVGNETGDYFVLRGFYKVLDGAENTADAPVFTFVDSGSNHFGFAAITVIRPDAAGTPSVVDSDEISTTDGVTPASPQSITVPALTGTYDLVVGFGLAVQSIVGGTTGSVSDSGTWDSNDASSYEDALNGNEYGCIVGADFTSTNAGGYTATNFASAGNLIFAGVQWAIEGAVANDPTNVVPDAYAAYDRRYARSKALPFYLDTGLLRRL